MILVFVVSKEVSAMNSLIRANRNVAALTVSSCKLDSGKNID